MGGNWDHKQQSRFGIIGKINGETNVKQIGLYILSKKEYMPIISQLSFPHSKKVLESYKYVRFVVIHGDIWYKIGITKVQLKITG